MFTRDDVLKASLEYFGGDPLAADVFLKYALECQGGYVERTPEDMHRRLAGEFARIEMQYPNPVSFAPIMDALSNWEIVAQGSPSSAVGNDERLESASNCFVIDGPKDSYGGIFRADEEQVQLMKRRGGVGFDISAIRPRGLHTTNAARTTDGIGVFMERYSNSCREVAQNGRRGALMLSISVHHPEVLTFIKIKQSEDKVTGANVSVRISDVFMQAVVNDAEYTQQWPVNVPVEQAKIVQQVKARDIWKEIIHCAWKSAEPGVLFWDTVTREGPADLYEDFGSTSTNPCFTGDTLVSVADGRGLVRFDELAAAGVDVPVYCVGDDNRVKVRLMRNPRKTGNSLPVLLVTLEDGYQFKATPNHKMILVDGTERCVSDLNPGDQLRIAQRSLESRVDVPSEHRRNKYWVLKYQNFRRFEHQMVHAHHKGWAPKGSVVHPVDFDSTNNRVENLREMSRTDHDLLHRERMLGLNNPIFEIKRNPEKLAAYQIRMSQSVSGSKNPRALAVSDDDILKVARQETLSRGTRLSKKDWHKVAREKGLPQAFSGWRTQTLGSVTQMLTHVAEDLLGDKASQDPRVQRTIRQLEVQGYKTAIVAGFVHVERLCEKCQSPFTVRYDRREQSFCSQSCSQASFYQTVDGLDKKLSLRQGWDQRLTGLLNLFTELRFQQGHPPKEEVFWQEAQHRNLPTVGHLNWDRFCQQATGYNHRVVSVEPAGVADVYNGTVDDFHNYFIGFDSDTAQVLVNTRNCGEIPLTPYDSCRLMLLNLPKFILDPFTPEARFDFDRYAEQVTLAQRLMDDLVDLELEKVTAILNKIESDSEPDDVKQVERDLWHKIYDKGSRGRRTGLGVTGLGDALAMLNLRYGSPESIVATEGIYRAHAVASYSSSIQLAEERGAFAEFDWEKEKSHPYLSRIYDALDSYSQDQWRRTGRRNIANLTTAPVGSISCLTQTTSGIEPAFLLSYTRRRKLTDADQGLSVDLVDGQGDKWHEYTVYHHAFAQWMSVTGKSDVKDSPYWGGTANDIDWVKAVEIQSVAQKWIDHAISKTINLPANVTEDLVSDVYLAGWKGGCKGLTVYRDGSRTGVLVSNETKPVEEDTNFGVHQAPKRPKELPCQIFQERIDGQPWVILVGMLDNRPFEIFGGHAQQMILSKDHTHGVIRKRAGSPAKYDLTCDDNLSVRDIAETFANPNHSALTRMLSLALRHGTPIQFVVEQLQRDRAATLSSFSRVIARVLKRYIKDGTQVSGSKSCPSCEAVDSLKYQEGCVSCTVCGFSKCG